ncbi:unnamed protein product [Camellia sinensis]
MLSNLPLYYLSLFKMPMEVAKELEKIEANFLREGTNLKKKIHMVKWTNVTKSTSLGGVGIRRITDVNASLLLKWWWKFGSEFTALWRKVLCSKYLIDEFRWQPTLRSSCNYSRVRSDIIFIVIHKQLLCNFFLDNFLIKVGDWNLPFKRAPYKWEEVEIARLTNALSSAPLLRNGVTDSPTWLGSNSGIFKATDVYKFCTASLGPRITICKFIWNKDIPPKIQFFNWLAWKDIIKSAVFLQKNGILGINASIQCTFCGTETESTMVGVSMGDTWYS